MQQKVHRRNITRWADHITFRAGHARQLLRQRDGVAKKDIVGNAFCCMSQL